MTVATETVKVKTPTRLTKATMGAVEWLKRSRRNLMVLFLVMLFAFTYFYPSIIYFIPAGHGGILWKRFDLGTQLIPALPEGVNFAFPWDKIEVYDLRLQEDTRTYDSVANDGLIVSSDITVRYRVIGDYLGALHKTIGPDYLTRLIVPDVSSVVREIISRYKADELYAQRRLKIQQEIFEQLVDDLMYSGIVGQPRPKKPAFVAEDDDPLRGFVYIQDVLIRNVNLPTALIRSIEQKVQQDQLAQEYEFRLQREAFEAQRKQLEAQGIKTFQDTISSGLTDDLLRWRGIEATLELARSPNAKVVVIGSGPSGMPLILNTGADGLPSVGTPADAGKIPPNSRPPAADRSPSPNSPPSTAAPSSADAAAPSSSPEVVQEVPAADLANGKPTAGSADAKTSSEAPKSASGPAATDTPKNNERKPPSSAP